MTQTERELLAQFRNECQNDHTLENEIITIWQVYASNEEINAQMYTWLYGKQSN